MEATQRILELAAQGLSNAKIAAQLNNEGHVNKNSKPFTAQGVWTIRGRTEKKTSAPVPAMKSDKSAISDAMREEIRQVVLEEIKTAMESQILPKRQMDLPPELPASQKVEVVSDTGRKHKRAPETRKKIAGTVDPELARLFEVWRKEQGGITLSRALDAALWHFLGKPALSFEITEKSDETEQ